MQTITRQMTFPQEMAPYLGTGDQEQSFERNAMILYPYIQNMTISHGRAAEILGVRKTDLIDFYDSMGIPYLCQSESELRADLATLDQVVGGKV